MGNYETPAIWYPSEIVQTKHPYYLELCKSEAAKVNCIMIFGMSWNSSSLIFLKFLQFLTLGITLDFIYFSLLLFFSWYFEFKERNYYFPWLVDVLKELLSKVLLIHQERRVSDHPTPIRNVETRDRSGLDGCPWKFVAPADISVPSIFSSLASPVFIGSQAIFRMPLTKQLLLAPPRTPTLRPWRVARDLTIVMGPTGYIRYSTENVLISPGYWFIGNFVN